MTTMVFTPKNKEFRHYSGDRTITPELFTQLIRNRSYVKSTGACLVGGDEATECLIKQIDATQHNAFTLMLIPFSEWHEYIDACGDRCTT